MLACSAFILGGKCILLKDTTRPALALESDTTTRPPRLPALVVNCNGSQVTWSLSGPSQNQNC